MGREGQQRVSAFECLGTYIIGTQIRICIVRSIFTKGFCLASRRISALKDEGVPMGTGGRTVGVAIGVGRAPRCERCVGGKDVEEEGQNECKTAHGEDREREAVNGRLDETVMRLISFIFGKYSSTSKITIFDVPDDGYS
jgi:hypothetical protein